MRIYIAPRRNRLPRHYQYVGPPTRIDWLKVSIIGGCLAIWAGIIWAAFK